MGERKNEQNTSTMNEYSDNTKKNSNIGRLDIMMWFISIENHHRRRCAFRCTTLITKVVHLKRKSAVNVSLFCIWINNLCVQTENLTAFEFLITIIYHSISRNLGRVECLTQSANELCQMVVGVWRAWQMCFRLIVSYKVTLLSWPFAWVRHFQDVYVCDSSKDLSKRIIRVNLKKRIVFFSKREICIQQTFYRKTIFCNRILYRQSGRHRVTK